MCRFLTLLLFCCVFDNMARAQDGKQGAKRCTKKPCACTMKPIDSADRSLDSVSQVCLNDRDQMARVLFSFAR